MSEEEYRANVLKTLNLIAEQTKPQPKSVEPASEKHEEPKGHKDIDEQIACPNCKPKLIEKLRPGILQEQRESHKKFKHPKLCEDCGEILDGEESKDCPNCHGHNY